jgi:CheY-like chemotaxis protein
MLPKNGGPRAEGRGFGEGQARAGGRILLVAARARPALVLSRLLEAEGYDVVVALGNAIATGLLRRAEVPVDLVLMAVDSEAAGEVAAVAREIHEERALPLVFLPTASEMAAAMATLGAYGILAKGSERAELLEALGRLRDREEEAREGGLRRAAGLPPG